MASKKKHSGKDGGGDGGQRQISTFFAKKKVQRDERTANPTDLARVVDKENIMGLDSNLRKPSIQKAKEHGTRPKKKNTQRTIGGTVADGRCDEGTKVCRACEKIKSNPNFKSYAHDVTCQKNANYKITNGGRITMVQYYLDRADEERMRNLKRLPTGNELCRSDITQDDVDTFFTPRAAGDVEVVDGEKKIAASHSVSDILSHYDTEKLILRINDRMKEPTSVMRRGKTVPMIISAAVQSLLDLIPLPFKKGTNELKAGKNSITFKKLQAYRKIFPPGTIGFTFPRADKTKQPNHFYNQLEGRSLYFVCWELNFPGWEPTCYKCHHRMIHDEYDFQSHGYATPIFQISGVTDYAVSMYYKCSNKECNTKCKANDGRMLMNVPLQFRNAYPVDPRYAVKKETHLGRSFSRVMDKMFVTHGNGDQLAIMLNELRGDEYLDREEEYFCQAIDSGIKSLRSPPTFESWIGRYSPSGSDLRELKDKAAESTLLSTAVSDKDRFRREIQSVGCDMNSASDHTFAFTANYQPGALPENACGHTIGTNTGEIASIAIVKDTKQIYYAHQAEQCSLRRNWNPKCHTTDNCPSGIDLWKKLIKGVNCQLGLFHYMYRITKTINKECETWKEALASLQTCMYHYDTGDIANVVRCLRGGTLGRIKGKENIYEDAPEAKVVAKAKTYREYVRIWIHSSETIQENLRKWLETNQDKSDEKGEYLFTRDTGKTVIEQIKKAKWVVDTLTKDELYLHVEPTLKSTTGLTTFIGARGTESKLEKGHHAIAHFANTGMRPTLADFLGMGGIALYNLRIRFRLRVAKMKAKDRAKIPVAYQKSPHFTNQLRLSHINTLGNRLGLPNVHKNVEILQPDNGELYFFEYYEAENKRETDGIKHDDDTNRCLCTSCGRYNNHYRKRKPQWNDQDDMELPTPSVAIEPEVAPLILAPLPPPPTPKPTPPAITTTMITTTTTTMPPPAPDPVSLQLTLLHRQLLLQQIMQQQQLLQPPTTGVAQRFAYSSMVASTRKRVDKRKYE